MHASLITLFAAASAVVSAGPLKSRQDCGLFPWFIVPYDAAGCTGEAAAYQPNSGPISSTPQNVYCQPLYNPAAEPVDFGSVSINRDACPSQQWEIKLYGDAGCTTQPVNVTSDICVTALADQASGGRFQYFDAVLITSS